MLVEGEVILIAAVKTARSDEVITVYFSLESRPQQASDRRAIL